MRVGMSMCWISSSAMFQTIAGWGWGRRRGRISHQIQSLPICLGWRASKPQGSFLFLPPQGWDARSNHHAEPFYMSTEIPNSGPHAYNCKYFPKGVNSSPQPSSPLSKKNSKIKFEDCSLHATFSGLQHLTLFPSQSWRMLILSHGRNKAHNSFSQGCLTAWQNICGHQQAL